MKILLTGNKGFIGSNVHKELKNRKHSVIPWGISKVDDYDGLEDAVKECDSICHVGAISDTMNHNYNEMLKFNYDFSKRLFDLAGDKHVVYSSSASVYGSKENPNPLNIYAWSKLLAEDYGRLRCTNFTALRYFNVYGDRENYKNYAMTSLAYQCYDKKHKELFPGKPTRDFIYVDDVVHANVHALESLISTNLSYKHLTGIFDVGTATSRPFEDILDIMGVGYSYTDKSKVPEGYQWYTKASSENWLPNWEPKFSLEDGLAKYKKYLKSL